MPERKPVMLNKKVYDKLRKFIRAYSEQIQNELTFSEAVDHLLNRVSMLYFIDNRIRDYILAFVSKLCRYENIVGVLLFGSVAIGTNNNRSDIDLLILSTRGLVDTLDQVSAVTGELESTRHESLVHNGIFSNISPLILDPGNANAASPIFFDFADYGIPIFERNVVLTEFLNSWRRIPHKRQFDEKGEVLTWTI